MHNNVFIELKSNYNNYKVWDGITWQFQNFKGANIEVCEWRSNFIPYFTELMIHAGTKFNLFYWKGLCCINYSVVLHSVQVSWLSMTAYMSGKFFKKFLLHAIIFSKDHAMLMAPWHFDSEKIKAQ